MIVTSIKPAVKTVGRYNIFVDGKYSFSLDEAQLVQEKLKAGRELDDAELRRLLRESDFGKHYMRVLELIARRPRSAWEIAQYLRRKGWEPDECQRITERLRQKGYLDDAAFVEFWIRGRLAGGKKSRRQVEAELAAKRVAREVITSAGHLFPPESDRTALAALIQKLRRRHDDPQKLMAALARRGFAYDDIKRALDQDSRVT